MRFAPSPTGYLHLGATRTALFNWLWARKTGGRFVLRVEDTDRERSTEQSVKAIFDALNWLGLDWDEGPGKGDGSVAYFQTERLGIYQEYVQRLIEAGAAYRCYCTKEDLAVAREAHKQQTGSEQGFRYPGTCRQRSDAPELPHVIRLRAREQGVTAWDDLVKGRIEVPNDTLQDAVLMRQNGVPLYNLGAAVDDLTMGITLVARGDDHMINTPQQIQIYEALGAEVPQFAHLPLIFAQSGEKLSKRHAAVSVMDYEAQGYLPHAVLNYLARLGWSHGDQEIFQLQELVEKFDWEHVGSTGSKYDLKKFQYVQATHLRARPASELAPLARRFLQERGLDVPAQSPELPTAIRLCQPRSGTLTELADALDYFFREPPQQDPKAAKKFLTAERVARVHALADVIENCEPFEAAALEAAVVTWLEQQGLALKDVAQPARVALSGRKQSPGLYEVMEVLGRQRTLARLRSAQPPADVSP